MSHTAVQRLVDGSVYENVRGADGRWSWVPDADVEQASDPHRTWAGLLSLVESTGDLDTEAAMLVMDLERGLHLLSRLHPDAGAVVAARVMNDLDDDEMDIAFPKGKGRMDWRRLRHKACAWLAAYIAGDPLSAVKGPSCERAYRAAR
ncbi:MAG: hypothetical protein ACREKH_04980 [Candidatus Rokuibacteriota bacterium]